MNLPKEPVETAPFQLTQRTSEEKDDYMFGIITKNILLEKEVQKLEVKIEAAKQIIAHFRQVEKDERGLNGMDWWNAFCQIEKLFAPESPQKE